MKCLRLQYEVVRRIGPTCFREDEDAAVKDTPDRGVFQEGLPNADKRHAKPLK